MILVVDDHADFRSMVCRLLRAEGFEVCGECCDGQEAVETAGSLGPRLILLDIQMPVLNGFEAARQISAHNPHIHICFMSVHEEPTFIHIAKTCGAKGFIAKRHLSRHLRPAIETLLNGEQYFPAAVA